MYDRPFRWWVQSVMPLVFDDSLSYYEVLAKLTKYIEGLTGDVDQIEKILATIDGIEDVTQFTEMLESIKNEIGNLTNLSTQSKTDLVSAINEVALKADIAYYKPPTGIPESDLSAEVQDKLNKTAEATKYIINNKELKPAPSNNSPADLGLGTYTVPSGGIPWDTLSRDVQDRINAGGGGTGGTTDYTDLNNKPQINGHTLNAGNNTAESLGLGTYSKPSAGIPETDLSAEVQEKLNTSGGIADNQESFIASRDYEAGELVYINGVLYKTKYKILAGTTMVPGNNIETTDISAELEKINSDIEALQSGSGPDSWSLNANAVATATTPALFLQYFNCIGGESYLFITRPTDATPETGFPAYAVEVLKRDGTVATTFESGHTQTIEHRYTFTPEDTGEYYCRLVRRATSGNVSAKVTVTIEYTQSQGISELWAQINKANQVEPRVTAVETLVEQQQGTIENNKNEVKVAVRKLHKVNNSYGEIGALNTSDGEPNVNANRLRSGFIVLTGDSENITIKSGYTFFVYSYNFSGVLTNVIRTLTEYALTNKERIYRIMIKPDVEAPFINSNFGSYFENDFSNCIILGTFSKVEQIDSALYSMSEVIEEINAVLPLIEETNNKIEYLKVGTEKMLKVGNDYIENGAINTTTGEPSNVANRKRSGYIVLDGDNETITIKSGYKFFLYAYNLNGIFTSVTRDLTTFNLTNKNRVYRIMIIPNTGVTLMDNFGDMFDNDFSNCSMYGTFAKVQQISNNVETINEITNENINFSLNEHLTSLNNMVWEYQNWVWPQCISVKRFRDSLFFTFVNADGFSGVARYDYVTHEVTKTLLKRTYSADNYQLVDDHNLIAVLMLSNDKLMCAYSGGHNFNDKLYVRVACSRESIDQFDPPTILESSSTTTYAQLFEYNNKIFIFYRVGNNHWAYRYSEDLGKTFTDESILITTGDPGFQYYCQFTETTTPGILRLCCYSNPNASDTSIRLGFFHLDDLTLYNSNDAIIGTTNILYSDVPVIIPTATGTVNRLFNAAKTAVNDTKVLYSVSTDRDNSVYMIYDNGVTHEIVAAGFDILPGSRVPLGVAWIGTDKICLARSVDSHDKIEIYDYNNGVITLERTIADNERTPNNFVRTGRPMIDNNAKSVVYLTGYFNPDSFHNFTMDGNIYNLNNT